jgi:hypothetical protein
MVAVEQVEGVSEDSPSRGGREQRESFIGIRVHYSLSQTPGNMTKPGEDS